MDLINGRLFEINVKTLIHIGVYHLRLFDEDLNEDNGVTGNKFRLMGRPAIPAVFLQAFHAFSEESRSDSKLKNLLSLNKFSVMKTWADDRIECEDMKNYLVKKNLTECVKKVFNTTYGTSYLACP